MKAYHGTNRIINFFTTGHIGKGQGQSVFPGIYFTKSLQRAENFAQLAVDKNGGKPYVYEVELELSGKAFIVGKSMFFNTRAQLMTFLKTYFPTWLDRDYITPVKVDYVNEKFGTIYGQYSLIQYAAQENKVSPIEIVNGLGYSYALDGSLDIVVTDPSQIDTYTLTSNTSATEATAQGLLNISRSADQYKSGAGSRFTQRVKVSTSPDRQEWQQIDMNKLFKTEHLLFHIPVKGETSEYVVELEVESYLPILRTFLKTKPFTLATIQESLMSALISNDVKTHCTCDDFKYRFGYQMTQSGDNSGIPQSIRSADTNPNDTKGRGCKHILFCLANKQWALQISRIIFKYITAIAQSNPKLFTTVIQPVLGITSNTVLHKAEEPVKEAYYGNYYNTAQLYDSDQILMLQIANDRGVRVSDYISPQNTPEQIGELTDIFISYPLLTEEQKHTLANPDYPFTSLKIIAEAYVNRLDLSEEGLKYTTAVLVQLLKAKKLKIPIDPEGLNFRQIEQLIQAWKKSKELFTELQNTKLDYNRMRNRIKLFDTL